LSASAEAYATLENIESAYDEQYGWDHVAPRDDLLVNDRSHESNFELYVFLFTWLLIGLWGVNIIGAISGVTLGFWLRSEAGAGFGSALLTALGVLALVGAALLTPATLPNHAAVLRWWAIGVAPYVLAVPLLFAANRSVRMGRA
jgi:hypothetical protein